MNKINNKYILIKYFLMSYIGIWVIATPIMLLALFLYGVPFSTDYEVFIGGIPLYLSTLIVCVSAIPSYYIPANLYFKKIQRKLTNKFALKTAFIFWGLSMLLDVIFVIFIAGIDIFDYPFNWIYLGVSPIMIISVYLAGIRNIYGGSKMGKMADIDEMMYGCGLEILHPGGIDKTDEMASKCGVGKGKKVLDIGVGKGVTPCYLAEKYGCDVVGIDLSEKMLEKAREWADEKRLANKVSLRRGDAHKLPFADETFDVVIIECVTTILDKKKAFSEIYRVLKSDGMVGDLEMIWRKEPSENAVKDTFEIWEGFETMTLGEWKELLEKIGFIDVQTVDFSDMMQNIEQEMKKELGFKGMMKVAINLMVHGDLRRTWKEYERVFKEHKEYIGYGYFIGRKK